MSEINLTNFPLNLFCSKILTRLPLNEAVRFSAVSRKWFGTWTKLNHLKFSDEFFQSVGANTLKRKAAAKDSPQTIIDKLILMEHCGLESIELHNCDKFKGRILNRWLMWISDFGAKCIDLSSSGTQIQVPEPLFLCVTLKSLSLKNFRILRRPPKWFQGFPQLLTCYLEEVDLGEEIFNEILRLCQNLENLRVSKCSLPSNYRFVSSSLKSLAFIEHYYCSCITEIDCPRLETIKITEFSGSVNENIRLPVCVRLETDFEHLQHFLRIRSLRNIACFNDIDFNDVHLLQHFPGLEELYFDSTAFVSYEKDVPQLSLRLPNLEKFTINIDVRDGGNRGLFLCSSILKGAPRIKTVRIGLDFGKEQYEVTELDGTFKIFNDLLALANGFPNTAISWFTRVGS